MSYDPGLEIGESKVELEIEWPLKRKERRKKKNERV